jgi:D-xylose transport system permease protein
VGGTGDELELAWSAGFSAAAKFMVTALVLLIAVTIDAVARRNRPEGT